MNSSVVVAMCAGIRAGAMIHDPLGFGGKRPVDRIRRKVQLMSIRLLARLADPVFLSVEPLLGPISQLPLDGIDWVIVGGESGPGHRLIKPEWVRDIRDQCAGAKVAFFFKQWGGPRPTSGGRLLDGRVWSEMPAAQKRVGCSSSPLIFSQKVAAVSDLLANTR